MKYSYGKNPEETLPDEEHLTFKNFHNSTSCKQHRWASFALLHHKWKPLALYGVTSGLILHWGLRRTSLIIIYQSKSTQGVIIARLRHFSVPLPPQLCWWWWAAWSTRTAGTLRRWRGCVARRQISTAWGTARCAGPTSWPSSASWTPSSWHFCPSPSATGRTNCCQMTLRWREQVSVSRLITVGKTQGLLIIVLCCFFYSAAFFA